MSLNEEAGLIADGLSSLDDAMRAVNPLLETGIDDVIAHITNAIGEVDRAIVSAASSGQQSAETAREKFSAAIGSLSSWQTIPEHTQIGEGHLASVVAAGQEAKIKLEGVIEFLTGAAGTPRGDAANAFSEAHTKANELLQALNSGD